MCHFVCNGMLIDVTIIILQQFVEEHDINDRHPVWVVWLTYSCTYMYTHGRPRAAVASIGQLYIAAIYIYQIEVHIVILHDHYDLAGYIPYSGKLSRAKTFVNFTVLCLLAKVFSAIVCRLGGQ